MLNQKAYFVDNLSTNQPCKIFSDYQGEIRYHSLQELPQAFQALEVARKQGLYAVGYFSYEAGHYFVDPKNKDKYVIGKLPVIHFQFYQSLQTIIFSELLLKRDVKDRHKILNLILQTSYTDYQVKFNQVQSALKRGDSYQLNLTTQASAVYTENTLSLFLKLCQTQPVQYAAYLDFDNYQILSLSPELFYRKQNNHITVKPMKGTAPRHPDIAQDQTIKMAFHQDEKNCSENLIIVDLLRNDLSRIAKTGSVMVESFCDIECYKTLYQMTSEISAEIDSDISLLTI